MENEENVKSNKMGLIIIVVSLLLIATGVLLIFLNTKSSNSGENNDNTPITADKASEFNGVYKYNDVTIKLYALGDENISYDIQSNTDTVRATAEFKNGAAFGTIFDENYSFMITNNGISLDTNSTTISKGTYDKVSDYSQDQYYEDNVGEVKYLSTNYNGIYSGNNMKVLMYNVHENDIIFIIEKISETEYSSFQRNFEVKDENTLVCEDDSTGVVSTITVNEDNIVVEIKEDTLIDWNGTYQKDESISVDKVLKELYGF